MKRFLSLVLCLMLVLGVASVTSTVASAEEDVLIYKINNGSATITGLIDPSYSGDIVIPDMLEGYNVSKIDSYAFNNCLGISTITIPSTVTYIDDHAFNYCNNVTDVYYQGSIADWCQKLNIDFSGNGVLNEKLRINGEPIVDLVIPDSVTQIRDYAFSGVSSIKTITIPSTVTYIDDHAFNYCNNVTDVYYQGSIADWCQKLNIDFSGNSILNEKLIIDGILIKEATEIIIPEGTTIIREYAFSGSFQVEKITIPTSLKSVGSHAFNGWSKLSDIFYSGTVSQFGSISVNSSGNSYFINATKHFGLSVKLISNNSVYASETLQSGETYTFPENPVNGTMRFLGWNEKSDGSGEPYFEGDTLVITASQTFYAQWECLHDGGTVIKNKVNPGCETEGYTGDTCCAVCGKVLSAGSSVGATGHQWTHSESWNSTYSRCTINFKCMNNQNHIKSVECASTGGTVVSPTCTEDGFAIYNISYSGAEGNVEVSKRVTLPATGHSYTSTVTKPATCSEQGIRTYTCSKCPHSYTEPIPTLKHTDTNNDGACDKCGAVTDQNKYNAEKLKNISISVPSGKSINIGLRVTITASVSNLPEEYSIALFDGSKMVKKGDNKSVTYTSDELTESKTFTAKIVDGSNKPAGKNGQSKSVTVTVNTGFFAMIIAFFQKLFGGGVVNL